MSNYHLRDMSLSLKAKGLLSLMLSLPENWDYTMKGLARICKDGIDSISGGIRELEAHGYLIRARVRGANGQLGSIEYTILEQPKAPSPTQEKPIRENPVQANPMLDAPIQENPAQLNKEESSNYAITAETRLIVGHRIDTAEQLFCYRDEVNGKIEVLTADRKQLYKLQRTAAVKSGLEKAAEVKAQIDALSKELAALRKEVVLFNSIAERSGVIQEKIKAVREDEQPERKEKTDHVQFR